MAPQRDRCGRVAATNQRVVLVTLRCSRKNITISWCDRGYRRIMKSSTILRATTLLAAAVSLALSVWLYFQNDASVDDRLNGIFVGVWVPSILALGNFLISSDSDREG